MPTPTSFIKTISIGNITVPNNIFLAPMAGISDRPFRNICRKYGAGLTFSEMITSDPTLRNSIKTSSRANLINEKPPIAIQILGINPQDMADTAKYNIDKGAQIIDINMGCPAKKVCNKLAGAALMKDQHLVSQILEAVVSASSPVPVTLKIRTGWDNLHLNAPTIAKIAEKCGIAAITIHGRSRENKFNGAIDFATIAATKKAVSIPIIANGDITSPQKAQDILENTGADGIMIGRGAQGMPWIFKYIHDFLQNKKKFHRLNQEEIINTITEHLNETHSFYGDFLGPKIARKHIFWYSNLFKNGKELWNSINKIESSEKQLKIVRSFLKSDQGDLKKELY